MNLRLICAASSVCLSLVLAGCGGGGGGTGSSPGSNPQPNPQPAPKITLPPNMPSGSTLATNRVTNAQGISSVQYEKPDGTVISVLSVPAQVPLTVAFWGNDASGTPVWLAQTAYSVVGSTFVITEEDTSGNSLGTLQFTKTSDAQGPYIHFVDVDGNVTDLHYNGTTDGESNALHDLILMGRNGYFSIPNVGKYAQAADFPNSELGSDLFTSLIPG